MVEVPYQNDTTMLLTCKRILKTGFTEATQIKTEFPLKIRNQQKIHTFRFGDRWKPGHKIHFWDESPRNKKHFDPPPRQFTIPIESAHQWSDEDKKGKIYPLCYATETWDMIFHTTQPLMEQISFLSIGGYPITPIWHLTAVANNDGLTLSQFRAYFFHAIMENAIEGMKLEGKWVNRKKWHDQPELPNTITGTGQIIHWTDKIYYKDQAQILQLPDNARKSTKNIGSLPNCNLTSLPE